MIPEELDDDPAGSQTEHRQRDNCEYIMIGKDHGHEPGEGDFKSQKPRGYKKDTGDQCG